MTFRLAFFLAMTALPGALTGVAYAAAGQEPKGVAQQIHAVSGEVDTVDRAGRTITIRTPGVVEMAIYAGPDLPIFDQLNRGDTVTIRYYDVAIVEVTPGARMKPIEDTTAEAQSKLTRTDASVMRQNRLVVTIEAIDPATQVVTYHGFDNRRVQRQVLNRQLLEGLKPGDVVTITLTRAQAVSITKQQ